MQAEHGRHPVVVRVPAFANITFVFLDTFAVPVAVGDLIAKAAAQSHIPERALDLVEAAFTTRGRSVMINDRGATRPRRVHDCQQRGVIDIV